METKKLYRIPSVGMLGGVCAGLGEYLAIDPTIIRLIFVLLFLTGSAGFWIYLIMLIVVPVKPLNA
jgi:phage shock protein C